MKKIPLIAFVVLVGCSQIQTRTTRFPANFKNSERPIEVNVTQNKEKIFANGADSFVLEVEIKEAGKIIKIDPKELKILGNREFEQTNFVAKGERYKGEIRPKLESGELKLIVAYQESYLSSEIKVSTYLVPQKEKIEAEPWQPSSSGSISGITYRSDGNANPTQNIGFEFYNYGNNRIVNTNASKHSNRQYLFEFPQHATQNISLMVVDAPNEFTSHGMYSHMMLFPRNVLPRIEKREGDEVSVILPTGENVDFNMKSGEILGGVFQEGPVDTSADRFKRKYANLHYSGKGILLRANARGQMPQQGQFENTKIDLNDGNSGSADVLIINGSTGERCRRPKSDFWSSADVQTILFKFPSDRELDAYLRGKCKFGIPELEQREVPLKEDSLAIAQETWGQCLDAGETGGSSKNVLLNLKGDYLQREIGHCLNRHLEELSNEELKREVAYDLYFIYLAERSKELKKLPSRLEKEEEALEKFILEDYSWIKDTTLKSFESECKLQSRNYKTQNMKFYDLHKDIKSQIVCERVKEQVLKEIESSMEKFSKKFLSDEKNFERIKKLNKFEEECISIMPTLVSSDFTYSKTPLLYERVWGAACKEVKNSEAYQAFLKASVEVILEDVSSLSFTLLEESASKRADACLQDYPANNAINKLRFKGKREACLTDSWSGLEDKASRDAFKKKGYDFDESIHMKVLEQLKVEARRLQLKVIKEKF